MELSRPLKVLIVDEDGTAGGALSAFFTQREIPIAETSIAKTLHLAIMELSEESVDHCYLSATMTADSLQDFFKDFEQIAPGSQCLFFLYGKEQAGVIPESLTECLHGAVSLKGTALDLEVIKAAEERFGIQADLKRRGKTVAYATDKLLEAIDKAACDVKRNAHQAIRSPFGEVIIHETDHAPEILEAYIKALTTQALEREVKDTSLVNIPKTVLDKEMPKLQEHAYTGRSQRVWEKLQKRYKQKEADIQEQSEQSASEALEGSDSVE
jgi:hypothetical protein